ncbi:MAG: ABC transporter ATP-binding protein [Kineosporiaceae bacterium]
MPPTPVPPPEAPIVAVTGLTKRFGTVTAVDELSFEVHPGRVTGFLGPNGAGKTTTMRILLGLVTPTGGSATIGGRPYAALASPARLVGAGLDGASFHPGRSGRDHLRFLCAGAGAPSARADELLRLVGLADSGRRRVRGYSLGMRQRLTLAGALVGDPRVLLLDEPANGLDPEGIAWLRGFLRALAAEGRTVLVSSHVLSEVQQTADDIVVIVDGRLAYSGPVDRLRASDGTLVDSPDRQRLLDALTARGWAAAPRGDALHVERAGPVEVGAAAHTAGLALSLLAPAGESVEQAYLRLVGAAGTRPTAETRPEVTA